MAEWPGGKRPVHFAGGKGQGLTDKQSGKRKEDGRLWVEVI